MDILAVIPARYNSQRFPGKPLVMIEDAPWCSGFMKQPKLPSFSKVIVATDGEAIADREDLVGQWNDRSDHNTGTDRVAEVAQRYPHMSAIANVQGDQPFVSAEMLTELVSPTQRESHLIWLPSLSSGSRDGYSDPNVVKVLWLQRSCSYFAPPIPYYRNPGAVPVFHHLGLYAFRGDFSRNMLASLHH